MKLSILNKKHIVFLSLIFLVMFMIFFLKKQFKNKEAPKRATLVNIPIESRYVYG